LGFTLYPAFQQACWGWDPYKTVDIGQHMHTTTLKTDWAAMHGSSQCKTLGFGELTLPAGSKAAARAKQPA